MIEAILSELARRDIVAAARWIAKDNRRAAQAFRNAVATAAARLGSYPFLGRVQPTLLPPPYRFLSLAGFRYVIVYNADRNPPLILRILHTSRDLGPLLRDLE